MLVALSCAIASQDACATLAVGGTVTTVGDYKIHTFTSSSTFNVTSAGLVDVLVVGGGGGGGGGVYGYCHQAGGGGGKTNFSANVSVTPGTYSIVVGLAGTHGSDGINGGAGGTSSFSIISSSGGSGAYMNCHGGASGSGKTGGAALSNDGSGGGGGDSAVGTNGNGPYVPGNGGDGTASSINGTLVYYGGGGGGQSSYSGAGANGLGGGMGKYGGGGHAWQPGGPGIVIIRYHITPPGLPNVTTFSTGTTNFSAVADIENVPNATLATSTMAVRWLGLVNAAGKDFDTQAKLGSQFVSFNISTLGQSFNTTAVVNMTGVDCGHFNLYYATGLHTSADSLIAGGTLVATQANIGGNCIDATKCTAITCENNVLTFTAQHFDGFGWETGFGRAVPEFGTWMLMLALALTIGGFAAIRRNN
jgi:hypothetical protein